MLYLAVRPANEHELQNIVSYITLQVYSSIIQTN